MLRATFRRHGVARACLCGARGFRALVKRSADEPAVIETFEEISDLPAPPVSDMNVTVKVTHSCLNYKDGMIVNGAAGVATFPIVPGINLAGEVLFDVPFGPKRGTRVAVVNDQLGQRVDGGFAQFARVPSPWLTALPDSMANDEAMAMGTAGFTAGQCLLHLERYGGLQPGSRVLVTGACGGVGSLAVALLAAGGHEVTASTGRAESDHAYLRALGATDVIGRLDAPAKPMERVAYDAAIDTIGGAGLAAVLARVAPRGAVAACGHAAGPAVPASILPFILRGIRLLGVDSVNSPHEERDAVWTRLDRDLDRSALSSTLVDAALDDVPRLSDDILAGKIRGRILVHLDH